MDWFLFSNEIYFCLLLCLGKQIHTMVAHLDAVTSLAVDPNGLYLLSGSKILYFWQAVSSFPHGLGSVFTMPE